MSSKVNANDGHPRNTLPLLGRVDCGGLDTQLDLRSQRAERNAARGSQPRASNGNAARSRLTGRLASILPYKRYFRLLPSAKTPLALFLDGE